MSTKSKLRCSAVIGGDRIVRFKQVATILGFTSDAETAQYLINRGLEQVAPVIRNWEVIKETSERSALAQADLFRSVEEHIKIAIQ